LQKLDLSAADKRRENRADWAVLRRCFL